MQLFRAAARVSVGDGRATLFWEDRWLNGMRIQELAPTLHNMVAKRTRSSRTVQQALEEGIWARDIGPELTEPMLQEYLQLGQGSRTHIFSRDVMT